MSDRAPPRIGIPELDDQHRQMARLREEIRERPTNERSHLWTLLVELFQIHFRLESWMMREDGFPDARWHEIDHEALLARLDRISREALDGRTIPDQELDSLEGWMDSHLRGPDTSLAEFHLESELWTLREESQWEAFDLAHPDGTTPPGAL